MKLSKAYWVGQVLTLSVFAYPTISTYATPFHEGVVLYGFPIPFYSQWGFCSWPCPYYFNPVFLGVDVLFLLVIPILIHYLYIIIKRKNK